MKSTRTTLISTHPPRCSAAGKSLACCPNTSSSDCAVLAIVTKTSSKPSLDCHKDKSTYTKASRSATDNSTLSRSNHSAPAHTSPRTLAAQFTQRKKQFLYPLITFNPTSLSEFKTRSITQHASTNLKPTSIRNSYPPLSTPLTRCGVSAISTTHHRFHTTLHSSIFHSTSFLQFQLFRWCRPDRLLFFGMHQRPHKPTIERTNAVFRTTSGRQQLTRTLVCG